MQLKLNYITYIFSNYLFKKSSDVATSVLPKAKECPTLITAAYVGVGTSRDQKGGFIYPYFYGTFMGFIQIKSIILRSTQYKVMVILVQGRFKAVFGQIQPIECLILFSAWSTVPM